MKKIFISTCLLLLVLINDKSLATVNVQVNGGLYYTPVLVGGGIGRHYDIVFIGDGFTLAQQSDFNTAVDNAVNALRNLPPYSNNMCAFNIWRVNVISSESGADHPRSNIFHNTELDCRYGNAMEAERCIRSDSPAKCQEAADYAPAAEAIFVLVNDQEPGGCAGDLVFSSVSPGFASIITHELGHKIAFLADEYDCYMCDGTDDNRHYFGGEPWQVNLTKIRDRATTKWASLINAATPLPTTIDNPVGVVGLWEGGGYYRFDIFRPQNHCQMRDLDAFCAVCSAEMNRILQSNCEVCQLYPDFVLCNGRFRDLLRFRLFDDRYRIRWPIPGCLSCPPFNIDRGELIRILLENINPEGFDVTILDEKGEQVARGKASGNGVEVSFKRTRNVTYSLQISARSKEFTGKLFTSKASVNIDGNVVQAGGI